MDRSHPYLRIGLAIGSLALAACQQDVGITESARCDGVMQPSEDYVDSVFDRDGDGFFDASNPECNATYDSADLDCDDGDETVNPGAMETLCDAKDNDCDETTLDGVDADLDGYLACPDQDCDDGEFWTNPGQSEVCGDGEDNNCNGTADEACETTYTGTWSVTPVDYSCASGLGVYMSFTQLNVIHSLSNISFGAGSQPGTMSGYVDGYGVFSATNVITGTCQETYLISGAFDSPTTFTATFSVAFQGSPCFDCTYHEWVLSGTKQ